MTHNGAMPFARVHRSFNEGGGSHVNNDTRLWQQSFFAPIFTKSYAGQESYEGHSSRLSSEEWSE